MIRVMPRPSRLRRRPGSRHRRCMATSSIIYSGVYKRIITGISMALFKYTKLEYIQSCVENGVYASQLNNINDPYEGRGIRYPDQYRVVCLTASPFQMLMWAYYGNHRGCCVEFDVDGIDGIRAVDYIKEFQEHEKMDTTEVIDSLYKKGNEWSHEKEFRIVYYSQTADKTIWRKKDNNIFLTAPVKRIIFGYASEMDSNYSNVLCYIRDYNETHKTKIEVTKCKLMSNKYQLEPDKQFNLELEIESI